jgi:Calcineurin-like phosphoesterase/Purple acid Phosphatase, N-terminal domain/PKD domain
MSRIARFIGAALVFVLSSTNALAAIKKGPYLLFTGQETSMDVAWQTDVTQSNVIRWGTDTTYALGQATSAEYGSDHQHRFTVSGLQPGTRYYYQVDGTASGSFTTAPSDSATAVKILSIGDTRSSPASQESVVARMRAAYGANPAFQTIVLQDGDWVSTDSETAWTGEWFASPTSYPQMHAIQAEVPFVGARGNHEGTGNVFKKYFPLPYAGGFYWSFDYGPVHVAVLDQYTTYAPGSAQYTWLQNDLAATTKPWKMIVLHEPGWTSGGSHGNNASVQSNIQPLCTQYGVDFVIGGHNHYYARAVVDGVNHLTNGGGGAPLYTPASGQPYVVKSESTYSYVELDVSGETLVMTARRANGTVIETITVTHATGNQPPVASAGPNQSVVDADGNGSESVILDGSASDDQDGTIAGYTWKEGISTLATGPTVAVDFPVGVHDVTLTVTDDLGATGTDGMVVTVNASPPSSPPGAFSLITPSNGAGNVSKTPSFDWADSSGATSYSIVVSPNSNLTSPVINVASLTSSAYASTVTLGSRTTYYWRVTATNANGSTQSPVSSFRTRK